MLGLFGRKTKRSAEDDLIPELTRYVIQIQETTGVSYTAIAAAMLPAYEIAAGDIANEQIEGKGGASSVPPVIPSSFFTSASVVSPRLGAGLVMARIDMAHRPRRRWGPLVATSGAANAAVSGVTGVSDASVMGSA